MGYKIYSNHLPPAEGATEDIREILHFLEIYST